MAVDRATLTGWVQETTNNVTRATPTGWLQETTQAAAATVVGPLLQGRVIDPGRILGGSVLKC